MNFLKFGKKNKKGNPIELSKKVEEKKEHKFDIFGLKEKKAKREERRLSDERIEAERKRGMELEKQRQIEFEKSVAKRKEKKELILGGIIAGVVGVVVIVGTTIGCIYESNNPEVTTDTTDAIVTELSEVTDYAKELITDVFTEKTEGEIETEKEEQTHKPVGDSAAKPAQVSNFPKYNGKPYVSINGGQPSFSADELTVRGYEKYSPLDSLGRCRTAIASLGIETMPKPDEERGSISKIYPSGWKQAKYDCISGKYLYNRCHLIGWQLSAENANRSNLITGTRDFNIKGMLPFENMVADYIKETSNHVAYRVTPVYAGNNLLASGVQIEAYSVEDYGDGICFNVYVYNVQPGININYATGASSGNGGGMLDSGSKPAPKPTPNPKPQKPSTPSASKQDYVLNTNSKKFHRPGCPSVDRMSPANRQDVKANRQDLINQGYDPCKNCNP